MRRDLSAIDRDIGQDWSRIIQEAFKHGIDCDFIQGGLIEGKSEQGLYEVSATQNYLIGTRRISPENGRVYRYAKATNIIASCKFGVKFWALSSDGIDGEGAVLAQKQEKDDKIIITAKDAPVPVAKDELRGGSVIIHVADGLEQQRTISGNTVASDGKVTIYLSEALTADVASGTYIEVYPNPYASVRSGWLAGGYPVGAYSSVAGMPNVITDAPDRFLWIQTWGPIWINPYGNVGSQAAENCREVVFDHEGAVAYEFAAKGYADGSKDEYQRAGFIINRQLAAAGKTGPPLIMLQISP